MAMNISPQDIWSKVMIALQFGARIPIAILIISTVAMIAFLGFFCAYRGTVFVWVRWLSHPW